MIKPNRTKMEIARKIKRPSPRLSGRDNIMSGTGHTPASSADW